MGESHFPSHNHGRGPGELVGRAGAGGALGAGAPGGELSMGKWINGSRKWGSMVCEAQGMAGTVLWCGGGAVGVGHDTGV